MQDADYRVHARCRVPGLHGCGVARSFHHLGFFLNVCRSGFGGHFYGALARAVKRMRMWMMAPRKWTTGATRAPTLPCSHSRKQV